MNTFVIEKGFIPTKRKSPSRYPFGEMEIGDSFFVECPPEEIEIARNRVLVSAHHRSVRISTRMVEGGIRVWKIA